MSTKRPKKGHRSQELSKKSHIGDSQSVGHVQQALQSVVNDPSCRHATELYEAITALSKTLDPKSSTMSSTNIPDAIAHLATVLTQMGDASHRVFELVERQSTLTHQLSRLGEHAMSGNGSQEDSERVIHEHGCLTRELEVLGHDILMAHEFQDLCGQRVLKVKALLVEIDRDLRALLQSLGITPPEAGVQSEANPDLDQAAMDALLIP